MLSSTNSLSYGVDRNILGVNIKGTRGPVDDKILENGIRLASQANFKLPYEIVLDDAEAFVSRENRDHRPYYGYAAVEDNKPKVYLNPYREVFVPNPRASTKRPDHILMHELTHVDNMYAVGPQFYRTLQQTVPTVEEDRFIASDVSDIARENMADFVADTAPKLLNGEQVSKETLNLYKVCGGRIPKQVAQQSAVGPNRLPDFIDVRAVVIK